jgi:hypothetical protein
VGTLTNAVHHCVEFLRSGFGRPATQRANYVGTDNELPIRKPRWLGTSNNGRDAVAQPIPTATEKTRSATLCKCCDAAFCVKPAAAFAAAVVPTLAVSTVSAISTTNVCSDIACCRFPRRLSLFSLGLRRLSLFSLGLRRLSLFSLGLRRLSLFRLGLRRLSLFRLGLRRLSLFSLGLRRLSLFSLGLRRLSLFRSGLGFCLCLSYSSNTCGLSGIGYITRFSGIGYCCSFCSSRLRRLSLFSLDIAICGFSFCFGLCSFSRIGRFVFCGSGRYSSVRSTGICRCLGSGSCLHVCSFVGSWSSGYCYTSGSTCYI